MELRVAVAILTAILYLASFASPVSAACYFIEYTSDKCRSGESILLGPPVSRSGARGNKVKFYLPVLAKEIHWYCGDSRERTAWKKYPNRLGVSFQVDGTIRWWAYICYPGAGPKDVQEQLQPRDQAPRTAEPRVLVLRVQSRAYIMKTFGQGAEHQLPQSRTAVMADRVGHKEMQLAANTELSALKSIVVLVVCFCTCDILTNSRIRLCSVEFPRGVCCNCRVSLVSYLLYIVRAGYHFSIDINLPLCFKVTS